MRQASGEAEEKKREKKERKKWKDMKSEITQVGMTERMKSKFGVLIWSR